MSNIEITFENPLLLLLAIPAFAVILIPFILHRKKHKNTVKKIIPVVLHIIIVMLLVLILSGFSIVRYSDEQAVMILVDLSDSTSTVQTEIAEYTQNILDLIDENTPVGVAAFGENQLYSVEFGDNNRNFTLTNIEADATNIEAALEYAASLLPSDRAGHIILLTDGKETDGNADSTAYSLSSRGIRVDAVYFDTTEFTAPEIQISSFTAPEGAYVKDEVVFTAELHSNTEGEISLSLYDNDTLVHSRDMNIPTGSTVLELTSTAYTAGIHTYRLVLDTDTDTLTQNNECYACVNVAGQSSILIIGDTKTNASVLENVLSDKYTVSTVRAHNAPGSVIELCNYDEVILSNVDYADLPDGYDTLLDTYVSVYGRSLLVVGGRNTYMYGNMEGTALEDILPVKFALNDNPEETSVALMLVLDCSNSMSQQPTYLSVEKQGAIKCIESMSDNDYIGIVSFNSSTYLSSPLIEANEDNKASLTRIVSELTTSRGTYYTEALKKAHEELLKSDADIKHIIFLSDGQPSDSGYNQVVREASEDGITVSTIGLDYSSDILESMAEKGGGRYYYVSSVSELPDIMLSETKQVKINSLITGEFVPIINEESELTASIGAATLPVLEGYLGTTVKENATAYITTEDGHPIYASWTYGLGIAACFTSDLNGTWSSQWLSDAVGQTITENIIETIAAEIHNDSSLSADVIVRGKSTDISVSTFDTNAKNDLKLTVTSDTESQTYALYQTAPGIYEASISTNQPGTYKMIITETNNNTIVDYLETAFAVSYSSEYDAFADSGKTLLSNICGYLGGAIFTDIQDIANVNLSSIQLIYNPMVSFTVIAAILLIMDIAIRRLRMKDIRNYFIKVRKLFLS